MINHFMRYYQVYKFIKLLLYFSIPLMILMILVIYIDPYNIIRKEKNQTLIELKEISSKVNYPLAALQKYTNTPSDTIILGDSRAASLNEKFFKEITHKNVTNLAYGGGTLQEAIDTFWIVSKIYVPKEVYMGVNFNLYNALNNKNRVLEANKIRSSLSSYLFSKYCIKSTLLILKSYITQEKVSIERPSMTREEFWKYQLDISGPYFFENYKYPVAYFKELQKISEYCHKNKIRLTIFIPPTHIELQLKIKEYKLEKEYKKFLDNLQSLGFPVYNFNFSNEMTVNKDNFNDPFHFNHSFAKAIIRIITRDSKYMQMFHEEYRLFNQ